MSKDIQPFHLLLQIGELFNKSSTDKSEEGNQANSNVDSKEVQRLTKIFNKYPEFKYLDFDHEDILIIACAWYQFILDRKLRIDPLELLSKIFSDSSDRLRKLDRIVKLLQQKVFYTEKKEIRGRMVRGNDKTPLVHYRKYSLLEHDICFHRSFMRQMLHEYENVALHRDISTCRYCG